MTWDINILRQQQNKDTPTAPQSSQHVSAVPPDAPPATPAHALREHQLDALLNVEATLTWAEREAYDALGLIPDDEWPAIREMMTRGIAAIFDAEESQ